MFILGKKSRLFNALGLKYGLIFVEGMNRPVIVYCVAHAADELQKLVEKKHLDEEEALAILDQVALAGLVENTIDMFALISHVQPQEGELLFEYIKCTCGSPLPHGYIAKIGTGGKRIHTGTIPGSFVGLVLLDILVESEVTLMPISEAVRLLKAMIDAGLPVIEIEAKNVGELCKLPIDPNNPRGL